MSKPAWRWSERTKLATRRSSLVSRQTHDSDSELASLRWRTAFYRPTTAEIIIYKNSSLRRFGRRWRRHLDHIEVLLRDDRMADPQPKFIAAGGGKNQCRDIDGKIRDVQAISNVDRRKCRSADEFIGIEKEEVDIKLVSPFGVGQAEVDAQLLVLKREDRGSEMCEDADQAFLSGGTVFNDAIADQKRLHTGSMEAREGIHVRSCSAIRPRAWLLSQNGGSAPCFKDVAEESLIRSHAAEMRGDFDQLAAV